MANTQLREFYQECLRRAWRGKLFWAEAVSALLALVAVPVGLWIWPTAEGTMNWVPLTIFVTVFVVTVLVALILAPYSMYRDVEKHNNDLEKKLFDKEARQNAISRLWQLRAEGVQIRNETVTLANQANWHVRTMAGARECTTRPEKYPRTSRLGCRRLTRCALDQS